MNILDFAKRKRDGGKLSMVTCYDYSSATILNDTDIDCLLVGDSLAMVVHGFPSTVHATVPLMAQHTAAVRRGAPDKFVVADMPFMAARQGTAAAVEAVTDLIRAGGNAVKIEGAAGQLDLMAHIVESGIPVMGHLGLTPQSVEAFGGHRVQGKTEGAAARMIDDAKALQAAGCFALVLECVPRELARVISQTLDIPTIGIGAGADTDGQVLVLNDMLGMNPAFKPKFLRHYANANSMVRHAINEYHSDVIAGAFPSKEESYA